MWLKGGHLLFSLTDKHCTGQKLRATDSCLTQLTAHIPVELGVEIGRVDAIGWGINPWQLPLVKSQELFSSVIDQRLGSGLAEWQNVTWSAWRETHGSGMRKCPQGKGCNVPICLCAWRCQSIDISPSFRHSCEATELVNTTRFDRSLLSFIVFLFLPPLKQLPDDRRQLQERTEESEWDHVKIYETGKVRRVWRHTHTHIHTRTCLSIYNGKSVACKRGLCISEAACKPQERTSKAKSLIGTRAHAVQQDSHTFKTHTQLCTSSIAQRQSVT